MLDRLLSLLLWVVIGAVVLLWLPLLCVVFVLTAPFDPGRYRVGRWFRRAAVTCVKLNPLWSFRASGVVIEDPRRPYVAVANHESFADIFLLSHLPWEMKWVSKDAIFRIPVMGWMMRMAGDIRVRRGDLGSRSEAVRQIRTRLRRRVSVMVFPEGTRSRDGELLPFRNGAFRIAVDTGTAILPIAVAGTRSALAPDSLRFGRARAVARVLAPVETKGLAAADIPALRERVRRQIADAREEIRRELAGADRPRRQLAQAVPPRPRPRSPPYPLPHAAASGGPSGRRSLRIPHLPRDQPPLVRELEDEQRLERDVDRRPAAQRGQVCIHERDAIAPTTVLANFLDREAHIEVERVEGALLGCTDAFATDLVARARSHPDRVLGEDPGERHRILVVDVCLVFEEQVDHLPFLRIRAATVRVGQRSGLDGQRPGCDGVVGRVTPGQSHSSQQERDEPRRGADGGKIGADVHEYLRWTSRRLLHLRCSWHDGRSG